jgi:hypothetical protein
MNEIKVLRLAIARVDRRARWLRRVELAWWLGAGLFGLAAAMLISIRFGAPATALYPVLAGVVVLAVAVVWWRERTPRPDAAAARIDATYQLDDRVLSAYQVLSRSDGELTPMERALVHDAADSTRELDPRAVARSRVPPSWRYLALAGLAVLVALFIPDRLVPGLAAEPDSDRGQVRLAGEGLRQSSTEILKRVPPTAPALRRAAEAQAELGRRMQEEPPAIRDVLADLGRMEETIARAEEEDSRRRSEMAERARARLERPMREAGGAEAGDAEAERTSLAELAKAVADNRVELDERHVRKLAEAARDLRLDLEKLEGAEELRQLLRRIENGEIRVEDLQSLAEQLEELEANLDTQTAEQLRAACRNARAAAQGRPIRAASDSAPRGDVGANTSRDGGGSGASPGTGQVREPGKGGVPAHVDRPGEKRSVHGELSGPLDAETVYARGAPGKAASRVPYRQAYPHYRQSADEAVERGRVPPHLRDAVRDYFDAINPDGR